MEHAEDFQCVVATLFRPIYVKVIDQPLWLDSVTAAHDPGKETNFVLDPTASYNQSTECPNPTSSEIIRAQDPKWCSPPITSYPTTLKKRWMIFWVYPSCSRKHLTLENQFQVPDNQAK